MTGAALTNWTIEALVASALLMAAVLAVRAPVRRAFGPGVAYALWALPALRLLLPPLPAAWHAATPITRASETFTILVVDPGVAAPASGSASPGLGVILAAVWLAGALALLGWHLVSHYRFCRRIRAQGIIVEQRDGVTVIASPAAAGPLAFGVFRRFVAFPADIAERYDADERELALAHELGHHARGDLLANWAALVLLSLHWFNPLAWRSFHAFRADQELANDARVLAGRSPIDRHAYACAILKAACGGAVSATCHLHTVKNLKGRLKMLSTSRTSRRRLATGAASIALLTTAGLGLTASGTSAAAAINDGVKASTGVDLQIPAPPAPPAPIATNVPPMPPAPPSGKQRKRVVIVRDGKATTYDGAAAEAYIAAHPMPAPPPPPQVFYGAADGTLRPAVVNTLSPFVIRPSETPVTLRDQAGTVIVPEIVERDCPPASDGRQMVLRDMKDGRTRITMCANRMRAMTQNAAQAAANSDAVAAQATISARSSLRIARSAIEHERNLTDDQRREALAGIAQAEAELNAKAD